MRGFNWRLVLVGITLAMVVVSPAVRAGVILGYDPARHNRFQSGYPNAPVDNPTFYLSTYDFSGVGYTLGGQQSVALVSPQNFIGATHFGFPVGAVLDFRPVGAAPSTVISRTVASTVPVMNADGSPSDVLFGTLSAPFTPNDRVTYYQIPSDATHSTYQGQQLFNYGQGAQVGRSNVSSFGSGNYAGTGNTSFFVYDYDHNGYSIDSDGVPDYNPDQFHVVGGDSGSPTFLPVNGQLFLLGAHGAEETFTPPPPTGDPAGGSVDSFLPDYGPQIQALLTPVPEPSTFLLVGGAAMGGFFWRRSRRTARADAP